MGRIPRRRLGAGVLHVVNRAINRQWIFESDKAKDVFLGLLASQTSKYQVSIHHWAIMSNHYHLAVEFLRSEDISEYFGKVQSIYRLIRESRT
jgi:REP element-mobilizing transposase RayT